MKSPEIPPRPTAATAEEYELEDFTDRPELHTLLTRFPEPLRKLHMNRIAHLSDDEASGYLYALRERRDAALRESSVSDTDLAPYFAKNEQKIWNALETNVFNDTENLIGAGMTARIKSLDMAAITGDQDSPVETLAIKYLVTPSEKTLSVSGEHDLMLEVEQVGKIEAAELSSIGPNARIRVPHPYFYYRKGKTQCYGMERVDGIDLRKGIDNTYDPALRDELRQSLGTLDQDALFKEIDAFYETMHTLCLHGDIKPANLMVSRDGHFYVIDFGQSVLATSITDKGQDAFGELKDAERKQTKEAIRFFLQSLYAEEDIAKAA